MDFEYSEKSQEIQKRLKAFMAEHVEPREREYHDEVEKGNYPVAFIEDLKARAREQGLWNLFLPSLHDDEPGTRLTNLEYAPCAEIMGRVLWASEVFNCSAPDTGNMELLHIAGTPQQRKQWLEPLMRGEIRSVFSMTEPDVGSSDATNLQTSARREGNEYVINGRKWYASGSHDPRSKFFVIVCVTDPENPVKHKRQSHIIVPRGTPGLTLVRNPKVLGHHAPQGHSELRLENVRVPVENLLGEEGGGFALSQARLGPGRIHHCMRSIGQAERAFELMVQRAAERKTFGRFLYQHGAVAEWIALSRMEIDQARLLTLRAAWAMDKFGNKAARRDISLIKVAVARMHTAVCDRAMQTWGSRGLTDDVPLFELWERGRMLQIIDGPDEVHLQAIARAEVGALAPAKSSP